jgi:hypothetical protein
MERKYVIDKFEICLYDFLQTHSQDEMEHWTLYHTNDSFISFILTLHFIFALLSIFLRRRMSHTQTALWSHFQKLKESKCGSVGRWKILALYLIKFLFTFNWHKRIGLQFVTKKQAVVCERCYGSGVKWSRMKKERKVNKVCGWREKCYSITFTLWNRSWIIAIFKVILFFAPASYIVCYFLARL